MIVRVWHGRTSRERGDACACLYYPEDRDFLLEFEANVRHYDLIGAEFGEAIAGFASA